MIIRFVFQFIFFWLKVAFSCFFVMALQIVVGGSSLEKHLEKVLINSPLGTQLKQYGKKASHRMPTSMPTNTPFSTYPPDNDTDNSSF